MPPRWSVFSIRQGPEAPYDRLRHPVRPLAGRSGSLLGGQARTIAWATPWRSVFEGPAVRTVAGFPGGELNTSYNCLDRHVEAGRGDLPALVWDSAMTGETATYTYLELLERVAEAGRRNGRAGVTRGDRVIIYMPMVPEAAIAMLACASLGVVHSVVFGGFAAAELAARIDATGPRAIIAASCGLEPGRIVAYKPVIDAALELADNGPEICFVQPAARMHRRTPAGPRYRSAVGRGGRGTSSAGTGWSHRPAVHPAHVRHDRTTERVVRDNGGHAVALAASIPTIFGLNPGDVYWAASDVGWVVGHSYIVYAPLLGRPDHGDVRG